MVGRLISISDSIARQPVCSQGFQTFLSSTPRCFPPFAVAVCRKRVFEDLARAICNLKQSSFALLEWVSQRAQNRRCTAMGYSSIEIDNLSSLSLCVVLLSLPYKNIIIMYALLTASHFSPRRKLSMSCHKHLRQ